MVLERIRNILVAFDGSPSSEKACEMASILAKGYQAKVVIAFAIPRVTVLSARARRQFETGIEDRARTEALKVQAKLAQEVGIEAKVRVVRSEESIAATLIDLADKEDIDLVVAGTRGLGVFSRMILGSVSTAILNQASNYPILVVRGGSDQARQQLLLRKILVATDGSRGADRAVELASSLAAVSGAELTAAHVIYIQPSAYSGGYVPAIDRAYEELREGGRKILSDAVRVAQGNGVSAMGELIDKNLSPVQAITEFAEDGKFDLIVVGTRGQTGLRKAVLGSVANGVVHYASCSVLVTR
jgi:nucleotide-binding universal stress UspA family protein